MKNKFSKLFVIGVIMMTCFSMIACEPNDKERSVKVESDKVNPEVTEAIEEVEEEAMAEIIVENAKQIQINNDITYQTIEGFGAAYAWYIEWMTKNPNDTEVYDLLFSEAKTTILRLKNSYKYNATFDPYAELELYQEEEKRAEANGEKITVLLSSWSPAAYLKENGAIKGGSSLKKDENGQYMYEEYAKYWLELVQAYEEYGIPIDVISIQNECDFVADYDGCEFGITETDSVASYAKAYLAVYNALQSMENPPKMMGPETMTVDAGQINAYMAEVFKQAPESVYGIAHHLYAGGTHETPNSFVMNMLSLNDEYENLSKWQTEYYRGDVFQTAWIMHNSLAFENLNAYVYWNGVWAAPEGLIGFGNPGNSSGWNNEKGYEVCDKLYALRHYSEFVRPGYKRIDVEPTKDVDLLMTAYASKTQDKLAIVAINKSQEDKLVQLHFSAYQVENSNVYISTCKEGYTKDDIYVSSGSLLENQTITIPSQGIVTIDISGKADEGLAVLEGGNSGAKDDNSILDTVKKLQASRAEIIVGEDNTEIWKKQNSEKIANVANGDHGASAEFKAVWDEDYLYIRAEVTDNTPDTSAADYVNQDSIEVYINEENSKTATYGKGDKHYLITRDNQVEAEAGTDIKLLKSNVTSDKNGYVVELAIPITSITMQQGSQIGFDIQVNDSHGNGLRNYILKWSDTSLTTDQSLERVGTIILN